MVHPWAAWSFALVFQVVPALVVASRHLDGGNNFTNNVYQVVSQLSEGSFVVSPHASWLNLAALLLGARGQTRGDLVAALDPPENLRLLKVAAKLLSTRLKWRNVTEISYKGAMYLARNLRVNVAAAEEVKRFTSCDVERLNYAEHMNESVAVINSLADFYTKYKSNQLLDVGDLEAGTRLVLANAVYFRAVFQNRFFGAHQEDFHLDSSASRRVTMVYSLQYAYHDTLHGLGASAVQINYKDGYHNLLVLLPKEVDGLATLERKMKYLDLGRLMLRRFSYIQIMIPTFKLSTRSDFKVILKQAGIANIFDSADLSGLVESPRGESIKVNAFRQRTTVEIHKRGADKRQPLSGNSTTRAPDPSQVKTFAAKHPFVFVVREKQSGVVLLVGRYAGLP